MSTSTVVAIVGPVVVVVLLAILALVHRRRVRRDLEGHFTAEYRRSFGPVPTGPGGDTPAVGDWSHPGPGGPAGLDGPDELGGLGGPAGASDDHPPAERPAGPPAEPPPSSS